MEELTSIATDELEVKQEYSVVRCKYCREIGTRYFKGYYPNGKDKIFHDITGASWSGICCPKCHTTKVALNQKLKRSREAARKQRLKDMD